MAGRDGGFELEGGMPDVEVAGDAVLQLVQHLGDMAVVEAGFVDDDVGGQGGQV